MASCPKPPYEVGLVAGARGQIETLRVRFDELEGYAGGQFVVHLPVTSRLIALLPTPLKPAFAISRDASRACNSNLLVSDCV